MTRHLRTRAARFAGFAVLVSAASLVLGGCTASTTSTTPETSATKHQPAYLWALGAEDASWVESDDASYLELSGVETEIARFTDRPDRQASEVDLRDFLGRWDGRFAKVPPNAVLSYQEAPGAAPVQAVVELSRPRYDETSSTLVFAAELIEYTPDELTGADHPVKPHQVTVPAHTGPVSVFIDSVVGPVGNVSPIAPVDANTAAAARLIGDAEDALTGGTSERARLLDEQIRDLLASFAANNSRAAELNEVYSQLNAVIATTKPDDPSDTVIPPGALALVTASSQALLKDAGKPLPSPATKSDIRATAESVKADIDVLSNTQQMGMLRLQTLSNKRNEEFETAVDLLKKNQEDRTAALLENMR